MELYFDEYLVDVDCVLFDGIFWIDDEMICFGLFIKIVCDIGYLLQFGVDGMIVLFGCYEKLCKVLIYINNINFIFDEDLLECVELMCVGIELVFDGMLIDFGDNL